MKSEMNKRSGETRQLTQTLQDTKEMLGQINKLKNDAEEQCQNLVVRIASLHFLSSIKNYQTLS